MGQPRALRPQGVEMRGSEVLKEILSSKVSHWRFMNLICVCLARSVFFKTVNFHTQFVPSDSAGGFG